MRFMVRFAVLAGVILLLLLAWFITWLISPAQHVKVMDIDSSEHIAKREPLQKPSVLTTTTSGRPSITCPPCPACTLPRNERTENINNQKPPQDIDKQNPSPDISDVSIDLRNLMSELVKNHRTSRSSAVKHQLQSSIIKVRKIMDKLELSQRTSEGDNSKEKNVFPKDIQTDVCPEKYNSSDLSAGYPFFYKGFNMMDCKGKPPFHTILSIVFNFVHLNINKDLNLQRMLKNIHTLHPNTNVIIGVTRNQAQKLMKSTTTPTVSFVEFKESQNSTGIWNYLVQSVNTRYVLIARDVTHFTWHSRLERLVREVSELKASVVAAAHRDLTSGVWSAGCEQSQLQNYTLAYQGGYDWSAHECMVCDTVKGPFVAPSDLFKKMPLPDGMNDVSGFETWFLKLKSSEHTVVSCPDSMLFTSKQAEGEKHDWMQLANNIQVERIRLSSQKDLYFTCKEANVDCSQSRGFALSHCCMNELSSMIKTFLKLCKKSGSMCELQEGTLLGAVKFGGVLPWERDADITFHSSNFSAISDLKAELSAAGYRLTVNKDTWCCVDGVVAGGIFMLTSDSWHIEIYGQHLMDSEKLRKENISPTLVHFDGQLVATPASPGLFARNRYGHEIYQHAQHWMTISASSGWQFYEPGQFTECGTPGHHSCLDQFLADGNIQFKFPP